jgi:flagellar assembly protein FliH
MAKVICTPTVKCDSRRKLPMGALPSPADVAQTKQQKTVPGAECRPGADAWKEVQPAALNPERLKSERDAALERAKAADAQLSKLRSHLAEERQKARDAGYQEGYRQAGEKVAAEQAEKTEALKALLGSMSREQHRLIQLAEDAAVEIGFAAAAKIIGRMSVDRTLLSAMIQEAMKKVCEREGLVVHLAARDCRRMEALKARCTNGDKWSGIEFREDEQVEPGGCIIRSRVGFLDARLEYQVGELKRLLTAAQAEQPEEYPN